MFKMSYDETVAALLRLESNEPLVADLKGVFQNPGDDNLSDNKAMNAGFTCVGHLFNVPGFEYIDCERLWLFVSKDKQYAAVGYDAGNCYFDFFTFGRYHEPNPDKRLALGLVNKLVEREHSIENAAIAEELGKIADDIIKDTAMITLSELAEQISLAYEIEKETI